MPEAELVERKVYYKDDGSPAYIVMTYREFQKTNPDFKGKVDGQRMATVLNPVTQGTELVPVRLVKDFREAEHMDVTPGYMAHMAKVNKGEKKKYPMRGKGKMLPQSVKDKMFGKKTEAGHTMGAVGDRHQKKIAMDVLKDPAKALLGGMDQQEAMDILRNKFNFSQRQVQALINDVI